MDPSGKVFWITLFFLVVPVFLIITAPHIFRAISMTAFNPSMGRNVRKYAIWFPVLVVMLVLWDSWRVTRHPDLARVLDYDTLALCIVISWFFLLLYIKNSLADATSNLPVLYEVPRLAWACLAIGLILGAVILGSLAPAEPIIFFPVVLTAAAAIAVGPMLGRLLSSNVSGGSIFQFRNKTISEELLAKKQYLHSWLLFVFISVFVASKVAMAGILSFEISNFEPSTSVNTSSSLLDLLRTSSVIVYALTFIGFAYADWRISHHNS